ncbi:MAG: ABC transporter ATP-binding protein [Acidobacteria bacterium]|nr:ABC transporter ATP-binding protein [Acidobacteriota bacterium]
MTRVRVSFEKVGKRFDTRTVLAQLSGAVEPGRVLVVAGPNGSGKSTLLNILAGVIRPSRGEVRYRQNEEDIPRARWFAHLGVAAPDMAVYDELTAVENLMFFARLRGLEARPDSIGALLEELGLGAREHGRHVGTYSSGMKQRVKLAQAVIHEPAVLLLDEPSSNLDTAGHDAVARLVDRFRSRAAVAVATNDPREMAWSDARIELAL